MIKFNHILSYMLLIKHTTIIRRNKSNIYSSSLTFYTTVFLCMLIYYIMNLYKKFIIQFDNNDV